MSFDNQVSEQVATTEPAAPEPAAIETAAPEVPAAPLTPGEAAKQARWKAEERARMARVKSKSDKLHQERQAFEQERKAHSESAAQEKARVSEEMAQLRKELQEYKSGNPLLKPGVDINAHLRELVAQGTPEAQIISMQKEMAAQKAEFEARLAEITGATKAREEEEAKRRAEVQKTEEVGRIRHFTLWIVSDEGKAAFKHLNAEFTQTEIYQQAAAISDWGKQNNTVYSAKQVAEYLESKAKEVHNERAERRGLILGVTPPASPTAASLATKASPPGSGKKQPVQVRQKTKEQEIEEDLALLRKATQSDAILRTKK